jgi:hypothetical protein
MVTRLHASVAVAVPVAFAVVSAGHWSVKFVGQVMTGGVMSRTVRVWTQLVLLPQRSVAVQVRAMTKVLPQFVVMTSLNVTFAAPQRSVAVATPFGAVLVSAGQSKVRLTGQVMVGAVMSRTVIICVQLTLLPHSSVAVQVRAMIWLTPQPLVTASL